MVSGVGGLRVIRRDYVKEAPGGEFRVYRASIRCIDLWFRDWGIMVLGVWGLGISGLGFLGFYGLWFRD